MKTRKEQNQSANVKWNGIYFVKLSTERSSNRTIRYHVNVHNTKPKINNLSGAPACSVSHVILHYQLFFFHTNSFSNRRGEKERTYIHSCTSSLHKFLVQSEAGLVLVAIVSLFKRSNHEHPKTKVAHTLTFIHIGIQFRIWLALYLQHHLTLIETMGFLLTVCKHFIRKLCAQLRYRFSRFTDRFYMFYCQINKIESTKKIKLKWMCVCVEKKSLTHQSTHGNFIIL